MNSDRARRRRHRRRRHHRHRRSRPSSRRGPTSTGGSWSSSATRRSAPRRRRSRPPASGSAVQHAAQHRDQPLRRRGHQAPRPVPRGGRRGAARSTSSRTATSSWRPMRASPRSSTTTPSSARSTCRSSLLAPAELRARFPWLHTDDLAGGSLGLADEGWFDAYALLQGFRRRARSLGVEERIGEVVASSATATGSAACAWPTAGHRCRLGGQRRRSARRRGRRHGRRRAARSARASATSTTSRRRSASAPRRSRSTRRACTCGPEGPAYIAGFSPRDGEPDPDTLDLATDRAPFETLVWPALAHRVPAFDRLRLLDTWAGHYEVNTLDHNAIIGPHPTFANLLFANGFSGHGLQQAPAVGRGLAEWIVTGQLRDDRPARRSASSASRAASRSASSTSSEPTRFMSIRRSADAGR